MSHSGGELTYIETGGTDFCDYMGCSEETEFTGFAFGIHYIRAYLEYRKIREFTDGDSTSIALILQWLPHYANEDGTRNETRCSQPDKFDAQIPVIPHTLEDIWERYHQDKSKKKDAKVKTQMMGSLLFIADETFQKAALLGDSADVPDDCDTVYSSLANDHQWLVPDEYRTIDAWRNDNILPKELLPECIEKYGEQVCERWNRIWQSFRMMDFNRFLTGHDRFFTQKLRDVTHSTPIWWNDRDEVTKPTSATVAFEDVGELWAQSTEIRNVRCEFILAGDQVLLQEYLDRQVAQHKAAVRRLRASHTEIASPSRFESIHQWIAYLIELFRFHELRVTFHEIEMSLFIAGGIDHCGQHDIYSTSNVDDVDEVERLFEEASADKAVFECTLVSGVFPDYDDDLGVPEGIPENLLRFIQDNELMGIDEGESTQQTSRPGVESWT
jgi:hypothetical protein